MEEPEVIAPEIRAMMERAVIVDRCFACKAFIPRRQDPCCQRCKDELKEWDERHP